MVYLILGMIISLTAICLMTRGLKLFGVILLLVGAALIIRGRKKFDKGNQEKGPDLEM